MTTATGRRLSVNPAQLRSLANWPPAERPSKAVEVVVPVPAGVPVARVRDVVAQLVRTHEALRSRLVRDSRGEWEQLVLDPRDGVDGLLFETRRLPDGMNLKELLAGIPPQPVNPEERAIRCLVYLDGALARAVLLSVSHLFADGVSQQLLYRQVSGALSGDRVAMPEPRRQASDFAGDRLTDRARVNTASWCDFLAAAPRFCTYTAARRHDEEEVRCAQLALPAGVRADVVAGSRSLGVSPYVLWTTAVSALVGRYTGQHAITFKTTHANRSSPADFEAVAQTAQAAFIPLLGSARDSLGDRAHLAAEASMTAHALGIHDTVRLLDWLDSSTRRQGTGFRPAFEINYAASIRGARLPQLTFAPKRQRFTERSRMSPLAAAADLAVAVWQEPDATVVTLRARPPVWTARDPMWILEDLLDVVNVLCHAPEREVADLSAAALPARESLIRDQHSGVDVDETMMRTLLLSHPAVTAATFHPVRQGRGVAGFAAHVVANRPLATRDVIRTYTDNQRWLDGSVVPVQLTVSAIDKGARA